MTDIPQGPTTRANQGTDIPAHGHEPGAINGAASAMPGLTDQAAGAGHIETNNLEANGAAETKWKFGGTGPSLADLPKILEAFREATPGYSLPGLTLFDETATAGDIKTS